MLLGVDLVKDAGGAGGGLRRRARVTAAFNLNLLHRLNRELGRTSTSPASPIAPLERRRWSRIEMHLVALRPQLVHLAGREFRFAAGETIHTESSHKYRPAGLEALAEAAGWRAAAMWTDPAAALLGLAAGGVERIAGGRAPPGRETLP